MAGPNYKNIPTNQNPLIPQEGLPQQPSPCGGTIKGCTNTGEITFYDWWPWGFTNCNSGPACFDDTLPKHPNAKKYAITFDFLDDNKVTSTTDPERKCPPTEMCDDYEVYTFTDGQTTTQAQYSDDNGYLNIAGWRPGGAQITADPNNTPDINDYLSQTWVRGCCRAKIIKIEEIPTTPTEGEEEPTNCNDIPEVTFTKTNPTPNNNDGSIVASLNTNTNSIYNYYWLNADNGNNLYDNSLYNIGVGNYTFEIEYTNGCKKEYTLELIAEEIIINQPTTTTPPLTTLTLNETPIVIEDCQDLLVSAKLYFSQPIGDCDTSDITASLLPDNDAFTVEQLGVFDSVDDGFGNWVDLGIRVLSPISGATFNLNLNFIGLQTCCEYDIRVDDIRVDCYTDEERVFYDTKKCPGFELRRVIDNKKSWVYNPGVESIGKSDDDNIIRNRGDRTLLENFGFVNRTFAPSADADLPWRYTDYYVQSNILEQHSDAVINNKELMLTFNMCSDCCYEYSPCPKGFTLSGGTDICYSGNT